MYKLTSPQKTKELPNIKLLLQNSESTSFHYQQQLVKAGKLGLIPATTFLAHFEDASPIHIPTVLQLPTKRLSLHLSILTTALHVSKFFLFCMLHTAAWVITENSISNL
jgi:hypothetical protein